MPTREEAEAMADAILAAHKGRDRPEASAPTGGSIKAFLVAGFAAGAIVALLPIHQFVIGGLVGLGIAGVTGAIAVRLKG
ncbi:MAG TPA: hypothetical protein VGR63_08095 [Casimicrobiaceae bacterium]|jgi:hypothetical protein|nr:hypothetical protein [Casimicrobiaceae bacterium]